MNTNNYMYAGIGCFTRLAIYVILIVFLLMALGLV